MTRDEAKRILEPTGLEAIDVHSVKNELLMSLSPHSPVSAAGSEHNSFYHANCEYDSLRYDNIPSLTFISGVTICVHLSQLSPSNFMNK